MRTTGNDDTRHTYDLLAPTWSDNDAHIETSFWMPELRRFKQLLPAGRVLEIGMAGGRDAGRLIELGYTYTGIDNSAGMVTAARQSHPGIQFLQQDVLQLVFPKDTFDGFWAAAILLHLPKKDVGTASNKSTACCALAVSA